MSLEKRSAFQQKVVEELVKSKAIDFQKVGATLSKFGELAALEGETLASIIHRNVMWNCGWPISPLDTLQSQVNRQHTAG